MKRYKSFLAPHIEEYITYRQNHGYSIKSVVSYLMTFDRYVIEKKANKEMLQPSFFLKFRSDLKGKPRSVNNMISSIRIFFKFLIRKGYYSENPLQDIFPLPMHDLIPFIFSPEEIDHLLTAVCKRFRKTKLVYLKELSVYMAILLLVKCGLRISEPLRLKLHDYRKIERTLYIRKTKFKKDRLIPVPMSVAGEIENYLAVRNALLPDGQNSYLLAGTIQKGLSAYRVRAAFHRAVEDIGLKQPRQIIGRSTFCSPTPHSLRHFFAVNTLKNVKKRGVSPQNALPVLAVYMGHKRYEHTINYLKLADAKQHRRLVDFANEYEDYE